MVSCKLAAAVLAGVMWWQPAQAAEPAEVELLGIRSWATLVLGGSPITRRFDAPFNTSLERDGLGSLTVQSSTRTGGGLSAAAMARSGRAMADFDSTQTFRFADTRTLLRDVWSEQTSGASASWFAELGPVSFLAEPGLYRLEVEGVVFADAPVGGGAARENLSSYLTFTVTPVPEPLMWELLFSGLGVVGVAARWRHAGRQLGRVKTRH